MIYSVFITPRSSHPNGRRLIKSIKDFGIDNHILLQGTVGQGKSIFLRYLVAHALYDGEIIPLFVQLHQLERPETLEMFLCKKLSDLGIGCDPEIFDYLAGQGKLALCLDGFDEVKKSERQALIREVEHLASKHDKLRIIITSRPESDIEKSSYFTVHKLSLLSLNDVEGVVLKLMNDEVFTNELMQAIQKVKWGINNLLNTPLMVTLLVIAYRADQRIPETLGEFYESLFNTLLLRHDKLKPSFERERTSGLSDRELRQAFDAFCFLCRTRQLTSVSVEEIFPLAKQASELAHIKCDPDSFVNDIRHITCLLLEEGGKVHFIHKSVSEYHCAASSNGAR